MSQVAQVLLNGTDLLVIGALLGPAAVVPYACTGKLVTLLANQPQLFMQTALPALSELRTSAPRARLFQVSTSMSQLLLLCSGAIACVVLTVNERLRLVVGRARSLCRRRPDGVLVLGHAPAALEPRGGLHLVLLRPRAPSGAHDGRRRPRRRDRDAGARPVARPARRRPWFAHRHGRRQPALQLARARARGRRLASRPRSARSGRGSAASLRRSPLVLAAIAWWPAPRPRNGDGSPVLPSRCSTSYSSLSRRCQETAARNDARPAAAAMCSRSCAGCRGAPRARRRRDGASRSDSNLGSGARPLAGAVNLDISDRVGADVVHDLNRMPWPFADDTFDEVHAYDVIEHLHDVVRSLEEIHRIAAMAPSCTSTVPHFSSANTFTDVTHRHAFGWHSFDPVLESADAAPAGALQRRRFRRVSGGSTSTPRSSTRWSVAAPIAGPMPTSNGGPGYSRRGSCRFSSRSSSARHEGRASGSGHLRRGRNRRRSRALRDRAGATHGVAGCRHALVTFGDSDRREQTWCARDACAGQPRGTCVDSGAILSTPDCSRPWRMPTSSTAISSTC